MAVQAQYVEKETYTEEEYFAFEQTAFGRWEFDDGQIRAMSGGTDDHNTIIVNIGAALHNALTPRGCRVYTSDMKVHTGDGLNTFPDVSVVCGPRVYHQGRNHIIVNPILLVEVLSPATQGYDRGEKWDHYQTIPTLTDYLLVAQGTPRVMLYTRDGDGWRFGETSGLDKTVTLPSIETTLALADIYALIEWDAL